MEDNQPSTTGYRVPAIDRPCTCSDPDTAIHSGVRECDRCWTLRKLDGPAASHWARVCSEFLSNIDGYDLTNFMPDADVPASEFAAAIDTVFKILAYADRILNPSNPMPAPSDIDQLPARWARMNAYRNR